MSPKKVAFKTQLTHRAIVLSFTVILLSGCAQRNTLQNNEHVTIENLPSSTIDFTHVDIRNTVKGLNITGTVINKLTWPKLRNTKVDIAILHAVTDADFENI